VRVFGGGPPPPRWRSVLPRPGWNVQSSRQHTISAAVNVTPSFGNAWGSASAEVERNSAADDRDWHPPSLARGALAFDSGHVQVCKIKRHKAVRRSISMQSMAATRSASFRAEGGRMDLCHASYHQTVP
jgi:hypothetical protein